MSECVIKFNDFWGTVDVRVHVNWIKVGFLNYEMGPLTIYFFFKRGGGMKVFIISDNIMVQHNMMLHIAQQL